MTDAGIEAAARAVEAINGWNGDTNARLAQVAITAYLAQREAEGFVMVPVEVVDLLRRYRDETPPRHSPHLICSRADKVLAMLAARPQNGEA